MRKIRNLLACVLLLSMAMGLCSCFFLKLLLPKKTSEDVRLEFTINAEGTAYRVTGSNISEKFTWDGWEMVDVVIPAEHEGLPVTEIGTWVFQKSNVLRSVTIPESMEIIAGDAFFDCNHLERVEIPKNVTWLYGAPFRSCNSLREILVDPENQIYCSVDGNLYTKDKTELVFYAPGKEQAEFEIPSGVRAIQYHAITHCENLRRITVPATVTDIPYDSIAFCKGLQGISVDERNPMYSSIDGNLYSKDGKTLLRVCVTEENTQLVIPNGVTSIEHNAAYYNNTLASVILPETVTSIGEYAFYKCTGLSEIRIPASVNLIGKGAFSYCTELEKAFFENTSGWRVVPQGGKFTTTKALDPEKLGDPETAAEYLSEDYKIYEWHLEE